MPSFFDGGAPAAADAPRLRVWVVDCKSASPSPTADLGSNYARQSSLSDMGRRLQWKHGSVRAYFKCLIPKLDGHMSWPSSGRRVLGHSLHVKGKLVAIGLCAMVTSKLNGDRQRRRRENTSHRTAQRGTSVCKTSKKLSNLRKAFSVSVWKGNDSNRIAPKSTECSTKSYTRDTINGGL